jgi:hypothetical protein
VKKSPFEDGLVPDTAEKRNAALAELFFRWIGPATTKVFAEWAGLALRDAKLAVEQAPLAPVAVEGYADDALVLESDLALLAERREPSASVRLLAFEDNFLVLHGGPRFVTDPKHHGRPLSPWGSLKGATIGDARHITTRCIVTGDGVVGFWEYDPDDRKVVTLRSSYATSWSTRARSRWTARTRSGSARRPSKQGRFALRGSDRAQRTRRLA